MNSSTNFSSGLIDYDSNYENNLDISPLHPFIYHFLTDFTILRLVYPPPPQKKSKTRNLLDHCLPFLLEGGGGEINKVHFGLCENGE